MQTFKLDLDRLDNSDETVSVYQPKGKFSMETVAEAIPKLRADHAPHLVLDMSGVSFLDSAGVGALVSLFVNRRSSGKTFALAALASQGSAVLTVAGLQNLLPVYPTLEAAIANKR